VASPSNAPRRVRRTAGIPSTVLHRAFSDPRFLEPAAAGGFGRSGRESSSPRGMFDLSSRACTRQVPSYHRAAENQPASRRRWRRWTCQLARMIRVTREWWPSASSERQSIGSRREVRLALDFLPLLSRSSQRRNNFSFLLSHQIEAKVITYWLLPQAFTPRIVVSIFLPAGEIRSFFPSRRITIVHCSRLSNFWARSR